MQTVPVLLPVAHRSRNSCNGGGDIDKFLTKWIKKMVTIWKPKSLFLSLLTV